MKPLYVYQVGGIYIILWRHWIDDQQIIRLVVGANASCLLHFDLSS